MAGLFEALWRGVGEALNDARQRVVEEGWFGRPVTDNHPTASHTSPSGWEMTRPDFDTQWAAHARAPDDLPGPDLPEHDIER